MHAEKRGTRGVILSARLRMVLPTLMLLLVVARPLMVVEGAMVYALDLRRGIVATVIIAASNTLAMLGD
jgi:hypothetical protein